MYVIVVGGGKVGYYLSKQLLTEGHEVLLMEKDRRRQAMLAEEPRRSGHAGRRLRSPCYELKPVSGAPTWSWR